MKLRVVLLLISLAAVLAVLDNTMARTRPGQDSADSAIVALAGEFRTVFANLLWIKVDHYHHEYAETHKDWTQNKDALGLNRLITKLDPHFEEAYATGAMMLLGQGRPKDCRAYLVEGIHNNPNSMMLHDQMGTTLAVHFRDYPGALYHLKRAYAIVKQDCEAKKSLAAVKEEDEWHMKRLAKLIGSVNRLIEEDKAAKEGRVKAGPPTTS